MQGAPVPVRWNQGPCFRYVVPEGWRVAEDGAFAVVLVAPDNCAIAAIVGNSGLPTNYPPPQFVVDKLLQGGIQNLQTGPIRPSSPAQSFSFAIEFDYAYSIQGVPCLGLARCHVAPTYGMCTMMATWAASDARQWNTYATWLPNLAQHLIITSPAAFGSHGIAQQNLANSMALGEQARENREYSQRQWAEVTQQRGASQDRQHAEFRDNLGNVQPWTNPYGYPAMELSNQYAHYWISRDGRVFGTNDPNQNPNAGGFGEWSPMQKQRR